MVKFDALVRGRLTEAAEDGMTVAVPRRRCEVEAHEGVVTLRCLSEAGIAQSVQLSADRFEAYLEAGAILILDAAQIRGVLP